MAAQRLYRLELEDPKENVFVTQLGGDSNYDGDNVQRYAIVKESADKLLDTGINTLQSTLLLKKEIEVDQVQNELDAKREEFARRMQACTERRVELEKKQQTIKDRIQKFEKFLNENEAKRKRAIQKYQVEHRTREQKTVELELLKQQLAEYQQQNRRLKLLVERYSVFEKFLQLVVERLPEKYLETNDSIIRALMMRHQTLNSTNKRLLKQLHAATDEIENRHQKYLELKQTFEHQLLVYNGKIASKQNKLEAGINKNNALLQELADSSNIKRNQSQLLGQICMAIGNIAEHCQRKHAKPISSLSHVQQLTKIQEFIKEKGEIQKMAKQ
ncbi:uncharacterized protein TRIADDRAFT_57096 [Trichoplax adhaerens]|uniref:DUF4200 domain-containing protein n=1 Tax=Trichoplax adhaerens TaxID=10228 RepID=B3S0L8_TRIAD|nr:hypothetical protein TRIADDRAFT_57096 [Trichoplax adhaerens]EDV24033.1 hypothetical protein TRIADDRAFT_57096 [Trichoplax adhaerens]|eukprot:XP_002113559.1 hypothetical protein TRIADDRAFT_57096 [Trichoplax adhaerens]